jgi:indolepyruvate ferredoxin oxidoreductase
VTAGARPSTSRTLTTGVDALVRLLVVRHQLDERDGITTATMVSGYPGSPLGTFDLAVEQAAGELSAHRVVHRPGLNEELAAAVVWGSQMGTVVDYSEVDGVAGVWYGKTPGLDRSGDALKHGNSMGSGPNGGVVLFCGDDPTAKSSTLACDSQYTFEDACIPVLYPGDQQEILDLGVHAFRMSRFAGCWVGLKVVTTVADGIGTADADLDRHRPSDPTGLVIDGRPWQHRPLSTVGAHAVPDQELLVVRDRLLAAKAYARHNQLDRTTGAGPGAPLGIVCAGKTYFDVLQGLADLGIDADGMSGAGVRILKPAMTYPLDDETVREFAEAVEQILVVEEKRPFVETQLRAILHEAGSRVPVVGKRDRSGRPLVSEVGELDAAAAAAALVRVRPELAEAARRPDLGRSGRRLAPIPIAARSPGFCSGCPHNRSTLFPEGALVGGGVGCHGIMYFEARHQGMKSLPPTPMGAEGVPWIGLAPFVGEPHLVQNLGDGTLSHSGTLAIRASVAAGVNVTFKILYNAAVAMTGGQDVTGLLGVPAMTRALEAEGVGRIVVCAEDPKHYGRRAKWAKGVEVVGRDRLPVVQEQLRQIPGVTVIIYDQRCAAEARRLRKRGLLEEPPRRVVINEAVCEGCGDCSVKSNCLSVLPIATEFGEKRQIHDPSCNRDYTCLEGDCPSFVTIKPALRTPGRRTGRGGPGPRPTRGEPARPRLPAGDLPRPVRPAVDGRYGIYFTGIGGTGVVTANRILAEAASAAGLVVGGMDQTGLSQKAGAVVSHLHLATDRQQLGSAVISPAGADLYLSGDILQAASERHLAKVEPGRTIAVVDCEVTPTAGMLQTDAPPPDRRGLEEAIADAVGRDRVAFIESKRMAEVLLGNHLLANVVLAGAAFQLGGLPMELDHIETAIGTVAPGGGLDTRNAFEWGRWAVHDPAAVAAAVTAADAGEQERAGLFDPSPEAAGQARTAVEGRAVPADLAALLARRTAQVIDYQDQALAGRFLDLVEQAAAADRAEEGWALTEAVAEAWFKLLTYKDEYEVARLHLKADYDLIATELGIEGPYKVTYHLHPPTLRRLGLRKKLPMGRPYARAFRALQRMKRLRGTPFDPFRWDPDRRTERALLEEYPRLVAELADRSGSMAYDQRVRMAASPMGIKGYGPVKEAAVARWRLEVAALRETAPASAAAPVP